MGSVAVAKDLNAERIKAWNDLLVSNRIYGFCKPRDARFPEQREPNPPQKALLEAWRNQSYKVFTYSGANRIGKCVTYETLIDTPNGEIAIGKLFENKKPFDVYAWDGEKKVIAKATAPFKKDGLHECYRIEMSDGRVIEAADHHRIFCGDGVYRSVATLALPFLSRHLDTCAYSQTYSKNPDLTNSGLSPSVPSGGVQNFVGTPSGYLGSCFVDPRQCGGLLRKEEGNGLTSVPSQDGVQPQGVFSLRVDGQGGKCTNTYQSTCDHPSTLDALRRNEAPFVVSEYDTYGKISPSSYEEYQLFQQPSIVEVSEPPQVPLIAQHLPHAFYSYCPPLQTDDNRIISINPIGVKSVYDFEVKKYHNYCAGGLVHHNTFIGGLIAVSTLLGEWPWSGEKIEFPHNRARKVRYVGQAWESHIKAVVEPMLKFWWPKSRPVETRKNNQGIESTWIDKKTKSALEIMSNVQDSSVFEGWEGDLIIYDEPPKRDVRIACARGLIDRGGRELFCMTLLKEAWIHREVVKATLPDGSPDLSVFNINGDIYQNVGYGLKTENIEQFAKTLTEDEKQARLLGKPSYMSSLVFPRFDRHKHILDRFTVPLDAIIDISLDWHPSKPLAVVFLATFKNGMKYVVDELKFRGNPKSGAEEIVRVIRKRDYVRVGKIVIDPLSRSGEPNDTDVFSIYEKTLAPYGYSLDVASKEKENGIAMVNNLLWSENNAPAMYFFKDCVNTIQEVEDLMYDPETFKPQKVNDDFVEALYRLALIDTIWYDYKVYESQNNKSVML